MSSTKEKGAGRRIPWGLKALVVAILLGSIFSVVGPGVSRWIRQKALEQYAVGLCADFPHRSGSDCRQEVERLASGCSRLALSKDSDFDDYLECLGFNSVEPPEPAVVIGACAFPNIIGHISFSLAKKEPWEGSAERIVGDNAFFMSQVPLVGATEVLALRLDEREGKRYLELNLDRAASRRLRDAMRRHVGEWMILNLNGSESAALIIESGSRSLSLRSSGTAYLQALGASLEDLCQLP